MSATYIEKLHAVGVRHFKELNVSFNPQFNFIAGPNGSGKTSLLAIISHCLSHQSFSYSRFQEGSEFWIDLSFADKKYRAGIGSGTVLSTGYRQNKINRWQSPPQEDNRESLISDGSSMMKIADSIPFFIGSNRNIPYKPVQGMSKEPSAEQFKSKLFSESIQILHGENKTNVKQWIINRDFIIEKEWAQEEKLNWDHMLKHLKLIAPFNSNFTYVRTGRDMEPVFSVYGEECYLEELSSGYQAVLLIITNIIEWIEGSRSEGGRDISKATGIVLIDEIDLHLHPEWQFHLRDGLKAIFPNIQFIVTTHSPHVLSSAKENEVIVLPANNSQKHLDLSPSSKSFSGWNTDQILADVMGVESLENKLYEQLIAESFKLADSSDVQGLKEKIEELKNVTHPNDVIVPVLQAKLASLVAIEND